MRDGMLEAEDALWPLPIKRSSDDATIGVLDEIDDSGICRMRALQGCSLYCDAYILFIDPATGERHEIPLPGDRYKEIHKELKRGQTFARAEAASE